MNLPNYLTLARIILVPLLVVILLTSVSENWLGISGYALAIGIFLAASLTDILDGHLARKRNQVSTLGKLLDPIADKLLVSAALIVLVEKHLAPAWTVVIILGREFIVTGLRSVAAADGIIIQAQTSEKSKCGRSASPSSPCSSRARTAIRRFPISAGACRRFASGKWRKFKRRFRIWRILR